MVVEDSGNTQEAFAWAAESGDVDWQYSLGWFAHNTITPELRGQFFSVRTATDSLLTLVTPLSVAPVGGDSFYLVAGLAYRSSQVVPSSRVNSFPPAIVPLALQLVTGVTIRNCFMGGVDLYVRYDADAGELLLSLIHI